MPPHDHWNEPVWGQGRLRCMTIGYVDAISSQRNRIAGWVRADGNPAPLELHVSLNGTELGAVRFGPSREDVVARLGHDNRRFECTFPDPLPPGALISGDVAVVFRGERLLLGERVRLEDQRCFDAWLRNLPRGGSPTVNKERPAAPPAGLVASVPDSFDDVSFVPLPIGSLSADGSAVVGAGGHLFLLRGANDLVASYRRASTPEAQAALDSHASKWVELLTSRAERAESLGVEFSQVVVPEKSTHVPSGISELSGVTPLLDLIEHRLNHLPWYISALEALRSHSAPPALLWRKLDTHLSACGALALSEKIVERSNPDFVWPEQRFTRERALEGDLTQRFFGSILAEVVYEPDMEFLASLASDPVLTESVEPTGSGRFLGARRVWRNEAAPIAKCVVVFGNSFFGSNPITASRCNFWFSRVFKELHFVWSPEVDFGYAVSRGADLIVGQTNERFLTRVPVDVN